MINKMQEVINRCLPLTWDESLTYVEALAKLLAKVNEIIASLGTTATELADIFIQITVIKEGEGGDLPSLAELQQAITAMKGTGWTTENLVALQDSVDTISGQLDGIEAALDLIIGGTPT